MSAAFDTINRLFLPDNYKKTVDEDEYILIQSFLSDRVRPTLPRPTSFEAEILKKVDCAYSVDFIGQFYADINKIQGVLKQIPP